VTPGIPILWVPLSVFGYVSKRCPCGSVRDDHKETNQTLQAAVHETQLLLFICRISRGKVVIIAK